MTDEPFDAYGSADCYYFVVNQIKAHYLAACSLLPGRVDRPDARIWVFPKVPESCAGCLDNIVDRLARVRGIIRREREPNGAFRVRVCTEAGIHLSEPTLQKLKELVDYWDEFKHSGDGEAWKRTVNLATPAFTLGHFNLTTAMVAAHYRVMTASDQPEWIRCAEQQGSEIILVPLTAVAVSQLMVRCGITAGS